MTSKLTSLLPCANSKAVTSRLGRIRWLLIFMFAGSIFYACGVWDMLNEVSMRGSNDVEWSETSSSLLARRQIKRLSNQYLSSDGNGSTFRSQRSSLASKSLVGVNREGGVSENKSFNVGVANNQSVFYSAAFYHMEKHQETNSIKKKARRKQFQPRHQWRRMMALIKRKSDGYLPLQSSSFTVINSQTTAFGTTRNSEAIGIDNKKMRLSRVTSARKHIGDVDNAADFDKIHQHHTFFTILSNSSILQDAANASSRQHFMQLLVQSGYNVNNGGGIGFSTIATRIASLMPLQPTPSPAMTSSYYFASTVAGPTIRESDFSPVQFTVSPQCPDLHSAAASTDVNDAMVHAAPLHADGLTAKTDAAASVTADRPDCDGAGAASNSFSNSSRRVLILIKTARAHFERRTVIRKTWASHRQLIVRFMMGQPSPDELSPLVDNELGFNSNAQLDGSNRSLADDADCVTVTCSITRESKLFQDILVTDFVDNYYNNTFKTLSGIHWAVQSCGLGAVEYVLVSDDDMWLNPFNLLMYLEEATLNGTISADRDLYMGYLFPHSKPMRVRWSKWYVPVSVYKFSRYPPYITASAILMSRSTLIKFAEASLQTKYFVYDDIFLAILAQQLGINATHNPLFSSFNRVDVHDDSAVFSQLIVSHGYGQPSMLLHAWNTTVCPHQ